MRRLLAAALVAAVTLAVAFASANASTITVSPGGLTRETSTAFTKEFFGGLLRVTCVASYEVTYERSTTGTLALGGNRGGTLRNLRFESCRGGTIRPVSSESNISFLTVEGAGNTWAVLVTYLVETEAFDCLYEELWKFRSRSNPENELAFIGEIILRIVALAGTTECPGEGGMTTTGVFRLSTSQRMTLTP
ncbi:MAG: hypothetical protein ACTHOE_00555 [Conexibacter sp.]